MLIRTQDKLNLVNLESLYGLSIEPSDDYDDYEDSYYIIGESASDADFDYLLGIYSSESVAVKVLDMIESAYDKYHKSKILNDQGLAQKVTSIPSSIFQMPGEDELC